MKTKFTILIAGGLLFAGVTQAQTVAMNGGMDFRNNKHEMVRDHRANLKDDRHEIRKDRQDLRHDRKVMRHHKVKKHHHRVVKHRMHKKF